jgi:hypothetical protein
MVVAPALLPLALAPNNVMVCAAEKFTVAICVHVRLFPLIVGTLVSPDAARLATNTRINPLVGGVQDELA